MAIPACPEPTTIGPVEITVCPADQQPLITDALVREQDTALLLDMTQYLTVPDESYDALVTAMNEQKSLVPGTVFFRPSVPAVFTCIVYDIEHTPVCRSEWLYACLSEILMICSKHEIKSLAMPWPGVRHGKISRQDSWKILQNVLTGTTNHFPEKIFLAEPEEMIHIDPALLT